MLDGIIIGKNWVKKGQILRLKIATNEGRLEVGNIIKKQLEQLGINVTLDSFNNEYYKKNINNNNYDILLTGIIVSIKPEITEYLNINTNDFSINSYETYKKMYEEFNKNPNLIGLYFNSIIIIYSKNLKGDFSGNWYNIFYNVDSWYKVK